MKNYLQCILIAFGLFANHDRLSAGTVSLFWNAVLSPGVAGYNIYYGTNSGNYTAEARVGAVTNVTITNLIAGENYYFVATTVDTNGVQSPFSNETSFIIPGLLTLNRGKAGSSAVINFPVAPSQWYEIQASTNLQNWSTIAETGVATSNAWFQFTDPAAASFSSRFYRLILH